MIDTAVREALETAVIEGTHLSIPGTLDRETYEAVNRVLERMGGKWSRKAKAHVFDGDPRADLERVLAGEKIDSTDPRTTEGFVRTPTELADEILDLYSDVGDLDDGARVLEPSAGDGQLVRAILAANRAVQVVAVEPVADRARKLPAAVEVEVTTLEEFASRRPENGLDLFSAVANDGDLFDAVVMNPPFSVPGNPTIWIDHVGIAWSMVKPGGRLTSIVPAGVEYRQDRRHQGIRELIAARGGMRMLPDGAFKESGTMIRTAVIWLDKEG